MFLHVFHARKNWVITNLFCLVECKIFIFLLVDLVRRKILKHAGQTLLAVPWRVFYIFHAIN